MVNVSNSWPSSTRSAASDAAFISEDRVDQHRVDKVELRRPDQRQKPTPLDSSSTSRVVPDEVQRVPGLFAAMKTAIDRCRMPGRFILPGSSNVLLVPRLSDSLAGRMRVIRLHPLSQGELVRQIPATVESARDQAAPAEPFRGRLDPVRVQVPRRPVRRWTDLPSRGAAGCRPRRPNRRGRLPCSPGLPEESLVRRVVPKLRVGLGPHPPLRPLPKLLSMAAAGTAQFFNANKLARWATSSSKLTYE